MPKSLTLKLTLAFIIVALITAGLVAVFIRITSVDRLSQLVIDQQRASMESVLSDYYQQAGSWQGVDQNWFLILRATGGMTIQYSAGGPGEAPGMMGNGPRIEEVRRNLFGLADSNGKWVVPLNQQTAIGGSVSRSQLRSGTAITVDGQTVGTLVTASRLPGYNPAEALFLRRTNQGLLLAILAALLVALLVGVVLANTLTHPLLVLTRAAENVAAGDLDQKVDIRSNDEIGELADAFNKMSQEVARVNQLRRQMTADVAHDLRTPLTVIAGYIESMRDGILPPTQERLGIIYGEIERLQNLVGDLRTLSQADSGDLVMNVQEIDLKTLLERSAQTFNLRASQQGIKLSVDTQPDLAPARLDQARMLQVMDNLLSNALRYTPEGGEITISAVRDGNSVVIKVIDTGSGIPEDDLPHVFERFHRADPSRHTDTGESGLGLAIVRAIVEAHDGQVSAESVPGHGTVIKIVLPL